MDDQERLRLQQEYPMWHIRRIPAMDCFMATRLGRPLTRRELFCGLHTTIMKDTYEEFEEALADQRRIEEDL
ncbi:MULTISPECIES: hypothetical protein [Actinomadura]|uniref:Uncharacterized protein n=1 Tax=Actinomadura litoris TaxID=2678616 RepID=A0A7K1L5V4_9ACTN|nr:MULTISPECIES: hypothetical protein [Actinomadura]MBT2208572.1 hypothetical protein [Actinomadura sp. NEAU-AAG7]MUN39802.1 hypothetical protein [Actinomadura litoris]